MTRVIERRICLDFDDGWTVVKWDEHPDYRNKLAKLSGSRALDVVGSRAGSLYFIELKDFRGFATENREKFDGPLQDDVALKVRDSLAGIIGAVRTSSTPDVWRSFLRLIDDAESGMKVVLLLATNDLRPFYEAVRLSVETKLLKQRVKWLTATALVVGTDSGNALPGVTLSNMEGVPPRQ